jgi:L-fuculose-phosphate aldolase
MACLRREIPPVHYLIGFAGPKVPVAPYATFGTDALADRLVSAMGVDHNAVLLANHGVVTTGRDLAAAFTAAEAVEFVARICLVAAAAGEPVALDREEMGRVMEKFKAYGRQPGDEPPPRPTGRKRR